MSYRDKFVTLRDLAFTITEIKFIVSLLIVHEAIRLLLLVLIKLTLFTDNLLSIK